MSDHSGGGGGVVLNADYTEGTVLWVNLEGFPWWPARVINKSDCAFNNLKLSELPDDEILVMFFNDNQRFSKIEKAKTVPFCKDHHYKKYTSYKGKYRITLMGAVKEAWAFIENKKTGGRRSPAIPDSSVNSAKDVPITGSPPSTHVVRDSSMPPGRRKKPTRRNSTSLETVSRNESNGDVRKPAKRKDKQGSSDGLASTRSKPRGKRGRKIEDGSDGKDVLHIPRNDKLKKPQRKRLHSPSSHDADEIKEGYRSESRVVKPERRKKVGARDSAEEDELDTGDRPKRRRLDAVPYPDSAFDDIDIPRRKPSEEHRVVSSVREGDLQPSSHSIGEDDDREGSDAESPDDKDSLRRKENRKSFASKSHVRVDDKQQRAAIISQKHSPRKEVKGAGFFHPQDNMDNHRGDMRGQGNNSGKRLSHEKENRPAVVVKLLSGKLPSSPSLDDVPMSESMNKRGDGDRFGSDPMTDRDEDDPSADKAPRRQVKVLPVSEDSSHDRVQTERKEVNSTCRPPGTWDLERISDYFPDESLIQPYRTLTREQLIILVTRRETEVRRCRLQLWQAECKLRMDRMSSPTEIDRSLKRVEGMVDSLVDWAYSRIGTNENREMSDENGTKVRDLSRCFSGEDKIVLVEKEDVLCDAVSEMRRFCFDPIKVDAKALAERLFQVMTRAMRVSRRAALALKNLVTLWADIYMFNELVKSRAIHTHPGKEATNPLRDKNEGDISDGSKSDFRKDVPINKQAVEMENGSGIMDGKSKKRGEDGRTRRCDTDDRRGLRSRHEERLAEQRSKNPINSKWETKLGESHGKWSPYGDRERNVAEADQPATNEVSSESGARSAEGERSNAGQKDLATGSIGRKKEVFQHGKAGRVRPSLNGTVDKGKGSERLEDSGHSTSGDEARQRVPEPRHADKDCDPKESAKRVRSGTKKQDNARRSIDEGKKSSVDGGGLEMDSKSGKADSKVRKNGSNSGEGSGNALALKRDKALNKLQSQFRTARTIQGKAKGERNLKDVHAITEMTEKLVFKRYGEEAGDDYHCAINSVVRALQQLNRKLTEVEVARVVEEDEVAAALKECFASVRTDLSSAVEGLVKLCLEQQQQTGGRFGERDNL